MYDTLAIEYIHDHTEPTVCPRNGSTVRTYPNSNNGAAYLTAPICIATGTALRESRRWVDGVLVPEV